MDHRTALQTNTPLCLCSSSGEVMHCVIESEIGRGGSCIVYQAVQRTETGDAVRYRIKEFYPYQLDIRRAENNRLVPAEQDAECFARRQERFRADFSRTNRLFYSDANYAAMTNQLAVFRQNGTSYIVSAYSSPRTLAAYRPETLKECVLLVRQTAYVLGNIHKQGYLYLDMKPDNVLVVDGYQKQVQLFDFDSLLCLKDLQTEGGHHRTDLKLSYSKGFAPIELQTSKIRRLGPHTDVYSVGALLFYLLFGRTPAAPDCETAAVFDFNAIRYDTNRCDDRLFGTLTDFFHHALAVYYADRYQSMDAVMAQLQEIEKYADPMTPRLFSTRHIPKPGIFCGREQEWQVLDRFMADPAERCLFITGMGGIGKSVLIREYLTRSRGKLDTVLYVQYKGSVEATIADDWNVEINTLRQEEEGKSEGRYFDRKLKKLRELVRDTASVLVIDNFDGAADADLPALLETDLKVVLVSRKAPPYPGCCEMKLSAIGDRGALRHIFEASLGRTIEASEQDSFDQIVKCVSGHTLVLTLLARQISASHITLENAAFLTREHGFSAIAPEKIDYEKDCSVSSDTVGGIIDALFAVNELSAESKSLLKVVSLIGDNGIDINQFQQIMQLASKDVLNVLIKDGWLMLDGDVISMHHVIREAVHRWAWTPDHLAAAEHFLTAFYLEIQLESTKNNYPRVLQERMIRMDASLSHAGSGGRLSAKESAFAARKKQKIEKRREKQCTEQGLAGKLYKARLAHLHDTSPADMKKLSALLVQAQDILRQCGRVTDIRASEVYLNLLYTVVLNTPQYQEAYILEETDRILSQTKSDFVLKGAATLIDAEECKNSLAVMKLYALVIEIHMANHRLDTAETLLQQAKQLAGRVCHPRVYAMYYDLLSNYYDMLLNGCYDTQDPDEVHLRTELLEAIDKTLRYAKHKSSLDGDHLYEKNLLAKATVLMRGESCKEKQIQDLMQRAERSIAKNTLPFADVRLQYKLVCAWYFALVREDAASAACFVKSAQTLAEKIFSTDLQKIEDVIIPCANIFFEISCNAKAMKLLYGGTRLCAKHANNDSYARIKQELCEYLWEVAEEAQPPVPFREMLHQLDAENAEIIDPKNKIVIPDNIRRMADETIES